jgi:hypothetical protein
MKKLFEVTAEATSYVVAEDGREAEEIIESKVDEDVGSWFITSCAAKAIESTWANCIPWGESDERTVESWLEEAECDSGK